MISKSHTCISLPISQLADIFGRSSPRRVRCMSDMDTNCHCHIKKFLLCSGGGGGGGGGGEWRSLRLHRYICNFSFLLPVMIRPHKDNINRTPSYILYHINTCWLLLCDRTTQLTPGSLKTQTVLILTD